MLRISRLTDYGTMILVYLAAHHDRACSASEVAAATRVALPTTQKLLKVLARGELVNSLRGAEGGYRLARPAGRITAMEILHLLEGPLAITECSTLDSHCDLEEGCPVGHAWQGINRVIVSALEHVTLADLADPPREFAYLSPTPGHPRGRGVKLPTHS